MNPDKGQLELYYKAKLLRTDEQDYHDIQSELNRD